MTRRIHEFLDREDGNGLQLVKVSPGCPCSECVFLRVRQNREQAEAERKEQKP